MRECRVGFQDEGPDAGQRIDWQLMGPEVVQVPGILAEEGNV